MSITSILYVGVMIEPHQALFAAVSLSASRTQEVKGFRLLSLDSICTVCVFSGNCSDFNKLLFLIVSPRRMLPAGGYIKGSVWLCPATTREVSYDFLTLQYTPYMHVLRENYACCGRATQASRGQR